MSDSVSVYGRCSDFVWLRPLTGGHKCSVFVSIALSLRKVSQSCLTVQGISLSINLLLKNSSSLAINDQH